MISSAVTKNFQHPSGRKKEEEELRVITGGNSEVRKKVM
jgi:hypothetical protein